MGQNASMATTGEKRASTPQRPRVRGLEASPSQRLQHQLGLSMHCAAALVQAMPMVVWWLLRQVTGQPVGSQQFGAQQAGQVGQVGQVASQVVAQVPELPVWGWLCLVVCATQFVMLFALWSVVDWSSLRIISCVSLMVGMLYAFLFAVGLLAPRGGIFLALDLADHSRVLVPMVCLVVLMLHGGLAWWAARHCSQWQQQVRTVWGKER
jgi:hypothetical protein